ncbi:GyrI-like domain-containing protein [Paenibacillus massiliensis]|uniref:GyrI-like domain-containing protein n=1 Tax=Paenibacillus massiliensis TaxID=225917 RepID=UPI0004702882|nr:GyrI-like domain-containing protein [Paenibacillus massiliensis]
MITSEDVEIKKLEGFKAAVLTVEAPFAKLGHEVRRQWKRIEAMLPDEHPLRLDAEIGYVFSPQWNTDEGDGTMKIKVGVKVSHDTSLPDAVELLEVPTREYVILRFEGDRERLNTIYQDLFAWIDGSGYKAISEEGVYWIEANRLQPVNPFDIAPEEIDSFDYDICIAVEPA